MYHPSAMTVVVALITLTQPSLVSAEGDACLNVSAIRGGQAGSRLAYCRWRTWLLAHPIVINQVPPSPALVEGSNARPSVTLSAEPVTIFNVDAANQIFQMSLRIVFHWVDQALALDDAEALAFTDGNSSLLPTSVSVPLAALWRPSLMLVEGVNVLFLLADPALRAEVSREGNVTVSFPTIVTLMCRFDMDLYPFDEHDCPMTVLDQSAAVEYATFTDVQPSGAPWDVAFSRRWSVAGEWDLVDVRSEKRVEPTTGMDFARFVLHIKRKVTFYSTVIIFPMVMTSYLNAMVFLLPPEFGDKTSYLVTINISMSVYTSFNSDMPRGLTSLPLILILLIFVLCESFVCLLMTLVVLRKHKLEQVLSEAEAEAGSARKGMSVMRKRSVSPAPAVAGEVETVKGGHRKRSCMDIVSAKRLDTLFFVTVLTVNTIGIVSILAPLV